MSMELQVQQFMLPEIDFNYDELKKTLQENLKKYKGLKFTEENIADGKSVKADLNKLKTALDTSRKDVKKDWNKNLDTFESKMKELIALVDEPIKAIDEQLKFYEEERIKEKNKECKSLFAELAEENNLDEFIAYDQVENPRWENKTFTVEKVKEEMQSIMDKVNQGIKTISEMDSRWNYELLDVYKRTLSLEAVIQEQSRLDNLEKMKAQAEAEKARRAEELEKAKQQLADFPVLNNATITPAPTQEPKPQTTEDTPEETQEEIYTVNFAVQGTKQEIIALSDFLKHNNIKFKVIK